MLELDFALVLDLPALEEDLGATLDELAIILLELELMLDDDVGAELELDAHVKTEIGRAHV